VDAVKLREKIWNSWLMKSKGFWCIFATVMGCFNLWWAFNGETRWLNVVSYITAMFCFFTVIWAALKTLIDWRWEVTLRESQKAVEESVEKSVDEYLKVMGFKRWDKQ
jgi:hypothetical protein